MQPSPSWKGYTLAELIALRDELEKIQDLVERALTNIEELIVAAEEEAAGDGNGSASPQ